MKVWVDFHDTVLDGDRAPVPSVQAICLRCGKVVEVYGRSEASKRRALCMMRDGCPRDEHNFYEDSEEAPGPVTVGLGAPSAPIVVGGPKVGPEAPAQPVRSSKPIVIGRRR